MRNGLQLRLDYKNYKDCFPISALRPLLVIGGTWPIRNTGVISLDIDEWVALQAHGSGCRTVRGALKYMTRFQRLTIKFDDPFRSSQWNEGAKVTRGYVGAGIVWKERLNAETCVEFQPSWWQVEEAWDGMYGRPMLASWKDIWTQT